MWKDKLGYPNSARVEQVPLRRAPGEASAEEVAVLSPAQRLGLLLLIAIASLTGCGSGEARSSEAPQSWLTSTETRTHVDLYWNAPSAYRAKRVRVRYKPGRVVLTLYTNDPETARKDLRTNCTRARLKGLGGRTLVSGVRPRPPLADRSGTDRLLMRIVRRRVNAGKLPCREVSTRRSGGSP